MDIPSDRGSIPLSSTSFIGEPFSQLKSAGALFLKFRHFYHTVL